MNDEIKEIAELIGAEFKGELPEYGPGVIGAERLLQLVSELRHHRNLRSDKPLESRMVQLNEITISESTARKLDDLAKRASSTDLSVSSTHVAARILEDALAAMPNP